MNTHPQSLSGSRPVCPDRGRMHDDPRRALALRDRISLILAVMMGVAVLVAV